MSINDQYTFSINLNPAFKIATDSDDINRESEEAYLKYCRGIGLPKYPSFLLANFTSKLHNAFPQKEVNKTEDIINGIY
jgi:hypothetical protein